MPSVSQFATAQNFALANQAKEGLTKAINEAKLAVSAGVPGADTILSNAQASLARVTQFMSVYFPNGTAPPTS